MNKDTKIVKKLLVNSTTLLGIIMFVWGVYWFFTDKTASAYLIYVLCVAGWGGLSCIGYDAMNRIEIARGNYEREKLRK